jgi:hypothetical protein
MDKDDRDILNLLQQELSFIEQGGYGRSVRTPWKPQSIFQDSLSCLNFADPARSHSCTECNLINFVSPEQRTAGVPCHQILLNESGDTIESLELQDNQAKTEAIMKDWLRKQIRRIEAERARQPLPY